MTIEEITNRSYEIFNAINKENFEYANEVLESITKEFLEYIALGGKEELSRKSNLIISLYEHHAWDT